MTDTFFQHLRSTRVDSLNLTVEEYRHGPTRARHVHLAAADTNTAFLVARYFGMKGYGGVYGALYGFFALGAGFGPVVFGAGFDKSGSYAGPLHVSAGLLLASAVLLLLLGRYRRFDQA